MELVCPAGNLPSLKAAVNAGANAVYLGFRDDTNARHFIGLNFDERQFQEGIGYARARGVKVFVALNTYPGTGGFSRWQRAVDRAADAGADALIIADIGVMDYAARRHPELARHLSVQGSATTQEALAFYAREFAIKRAVLPRVLALKQVADVARAAPVDLEVFGFGSLCIMVEGRCSLSSYVTGQSPNLCGVCSPAAHVRWEHRGEHLESRLSGVLIDRFAPEEQAGYPTLCKGRFKVGEAVYHALEEPTSLNTLALLPALHKLGIRAIKIEGRQRSPAYVESVTRVWRDAIDRCLTDPENYQPGDTAMSILGGLSEGSQTTLGAYERRWQ